MTQDRPADRRRARAITRILEATLALVRTHGIGALTMADIAREADYTAGALYRYFPSKGALLGELLRRMLEGLTGDLVLAMAAHDDPLVRVLSIAVEVRRRAATEDPVLALLRATMGDPIQHVPDDEAVHIPAVTALFGLVATEVAGAQASGALAGGDAVARALRLMFGTLGVLQLDKLSRFDPRLAPAPLADALTVDLLLAWGANPESLERARAHLSEIP